MIRKARRKASILLAEAFRPSFLMLQLQKVPRRNPVYFIKKTGFRITCATRVSGTPLFFNSLAACLRKRIYKKRSSPEWSGELEKSSAAQRLEVKPL
jgi:hypothetical protein